MDPGAVAIVAPFVVVSVAIAIWGAVTLDPGVRFRARIFLGGAGYTMPKRLGLLISPVMTLIIGVAIAVLIGEAEVPSSLLWLGVASLIINLIGQIAGIRAAR